MAPTKFEEGLKKTLEERRLQPSESSWNKLDERLEAGKQKKNNGMWWLGIAASLVGVLIVASIIFKGDTEKIQPAIVDTETQVTTPEEAEEEVVVESDQGIEAKKPDETIEKAGIRQKPVLQKVLKEKQDELIRESKSDVVAKAEVKDPEAIETSREIKELSYEDKKVLQVVDQIKQLKATGQAVSDAEIDSLLIQAQRDIQLQKIYNEATKTVDAEALLRDVEADLDQSFRERVFKALRSGYENVKTAVAERNN